MTARINLAPEVYQQRQAAKRHKRVATSLGILVAGIAGGIVVVLLLVIGGQKVYLASANKTIQDDESQLKNTPHLQDALTVQQDVTSLGTLENQKPVVSRFLSILQQTDPQGVSLTQLTMASDGSLKVQARATSYLLATKLAKALEASNVTIGQGAAATNQPYFTDVNLLTVSDDGQGGETFQLTAQVSSEVTNGNN